MAGSYLGTGATHVVCHPQTAVKWLTMGKSSGLVHCPSHLPETLLPSFGCLLRMMFLEQAFEMLNMGSWGVLIVSVTSSVAPSLLLPTIGLSLLHACSMVAPSSVSCLLASAHVHAVACQYCLCSCFDACPSKPFTSVDPFCLKLPSPQRKLKCESQDSVHMTDYTRCTWHRSEYCISSLAAAVSGSGYP